MPRTQFNAKVREETLRDFYRAYTFDLDHKGRQKRIGEVVEKLMDDYVRQVFSRKEVERELSRLRRG
ncbi:MAG: hypothetical protein V1787_05050 [Candidatus Micrarchaeota archaeon]